MFCKIAFFGFFCYHLLSFYLFDGLSNDVLKDFFTLNYPLITMTENTGYLKYHIIPYSIVWIELLHGQRWVYAEYKNVTYVNDVFSVMHFSKNTSCTFGNNMSSFNLNIICDPLQKFQVGNLTLYDNECTTDLDVYTEMGCRYIYGDKYDDKYEL